MKLFMYEFLYYFLWYLFMTKIARKVIHSEAKKDNHIPYIPHNFDMLYAQILMASTPLSIEITNACVVLPIAEK